MSCTYTLITKITDICNGAWQVSDMAILANMAFSVFGSRIVVEGNKKSPPDLRGASPSHFSHFFGTLSGHYPRKPLYSSASGRIPLSPLSMKAHLR